MNMVQKLEVCSPSESIFLRVLKCGVQSEQDAMKRSLCRAVSSPEKVLLKQIGVELHPLQPAVIT